MRLKLKRLLSAELITIVLIGGLIFGFYKLFKDENSLTISEKTWISNNKNSYTEYKYKDYTKLPKIELTVISICLIIVGVSIITFI